MPFHVGDRVKYKELFRVNMPHNANGVNEFTIRCVHLRGEMETSYHLLDCVPHQGSDCPGGQFSWNAVDSELELLGSRQFKIGDKVRCVLPEIFVNQPGVPLTSDIYGGSGWVNEREFIITRQHGSCRPSSGRVENIFWDGQTGLGVWESWLVLVTPAAALPPPRVDVFTIGSDIEVCFIKSRSQVNASGALCNGYRDDGTFGTDHGGEVGEFRPRYGHDPLEHIKNLEEAIRRVVEGKNMRPGTKIDSSHILGSRVVGGHIHFGIKDRQLQAMCKKNLDYWLLPTIQPLFPESVFMKRVESGYGKLNTDDVRQQPHGFEYRLVPSFIFNKKVAQGIFCLAYVIVQLTVTGKLKVRIDEKDDKWISNFINDYNTYGLNKLNDLREESIKELMDKNLLGDLAKHIYPLFDAIRNEEKFSGDVAEGWGMKYQYVRDSGDKEITVTDRLRSMLIR